MQAANFKGGKNQLQNTIIKLIIRLVYNVFSWYNKLILLINMCTGLWNLIESYALQWCLNINYVLSIQITHIHLCIYGTALK